MEETAPEIKKVDDGSWYWGGAVITGVLVFIGVWIYAMTQWGFLFGIMFGWIPALIAGLIGGVLWPLIAIVVVWLIIHIL